MLLKTGRLILTVIGFAVFLGPIELHQSGCREKRKVAAPRPKETEVSAIVHGTTFREGIFEVNLPSSFTRVPPAELGEIRRAMVGGGRELAEASKSGEARYISENTITFLSAFQTEGGRLALAIAGIQSPAAWDNLDEVYKTSTQRIQWGIDSGRLRKTSKGVSKLSIDGVPCVLQDIETQGSSRMQTYLFFLPDAPRTTFQFAVNCADSATWNAHAREIEAIITSLRIIRKSP